MHKKFVVRFCDKWPRGWYTVFRPPLQNLWIRNCSTKWKLSSGKRPPQNGHFPWYGTVHHGRSCITWLAKVQNDTAFFYL